VHQADQLDILVARLNKKCFSWVALGLEKVNRVMWESLHKVSGFGDRLMQERFGDLGLVDVFLHPAKFQPCRHGNPDVNKN
jgi:hypothetical protein